MFGLVCFFSCFVLSRNGCNQNQKKNVALYTVNGDDGDDGVNNALPLSSNEKKSHCDAKTVFEQDQSKVKSPESSFQ